MTKLREANLEMKHGDSCICPTCGAQGVIDTETPDNQGVVFQCAVWLNKNSGEWECYDCWLK